MFCTYTRIVCVSKYRKLHRYFSAEGNENDDCEMKNKQEKF